MKDKHKVRVRENVPTHQEWLEDKENNDTLSGENRWEGQSPWAQIPLSDRESDQFEALIDIYPSLKGRQKQIVELLFDGIINQTTIADMLNMDQRDVNKQLRLVAKKILKKYP